MELSTIALPLLDEGVAFAKSWMGQCRILVHHLVEAGEEKVANCGIHMDKQ